MDFNHIRILNILNLKEAIDKGERKKLENDKIYLSSFLAMSLFQYETVKNLQQNAQV